MSFQEDIVMKGYAFTIALGLAFLFGYFTGHVPAYQQYRPIVVQYQCDPSVGCP